MAEDKEQHVCDTEPNSINEVQESNEPVEQIISRLNDGNLGSDELVRLAMTDQDMTLIIKDIHKINQPLLSEADLVDKICQEIIRDIENEVDAHLQKYSKYTLVTKSTKEIDQISSKFFKLISLLKDVSVLSRKLLQAMPQFESPAEKSSNLTPSSLHSGGMDFRDNRSSQKLTGDDATSEDLLDALIESSSTDDFLVLTSSLDSITLRDMILTVYILIKAHECFTLSHDFHGVAIILRRAKFVILNILAPKNQMELVTKLLTSIGRYREMNYVFDLFRDRNQFELLLSKGVEKTPNLRLALFNYVKKNPEFYALVTLNFSMFREIAESLEESAMKRLDKLISSKETKKQQQTKQRRSQPQQQLQRRQSDKHKINSSGSRISSKTDELQGQSEQKQLHATTRDVTTTDNVQQDSLCSKPSPSSSSSMIKSPSFVIQPQAGQQEEPHSILKTSHSYGKNLDALIAAASSMTKSQSASNSIAKPGDCDKRAALYSEEGLNLCLVELVDAADCFAKAGCYMKSNSCESKAKLIALQLALLPSGTNVIALEQSELNDLIVSFGSFKNAYIVAEAYNYHLAWRQALFKNVILRAAVHQVQTKATESHSGVDSDSIRYLKEFCQKCDLSTALVSELVFLYKQHIIGDGGRNETMNGCNYLTAKDVEQEAAAGLVDNQFSVSNHNFLEGSANAMKMVIALIVDVESRFKIYTQLNFVDAKEELLRDPATQAYLKDLKLA